MYKYLLDENKNQFFPLIDNKSIINANTVNDVQIEELFNPTVEDILIEDEYRFLRGQYPSASIGVECIPERAGKQAYLDVTTSNPDCCNVAYIDGSTIGLNANRRGESTITITETNSGISKEAKVFIQGAPRLYAHGSGPMYVSSYTLQESFDEAIYRVEAYSHSSSDQFSHWSDGSTENPREITIYEDTELTAYYKPILYKVEVRSSNNDWGTVRGGGSVRRGSGIVIKAIPNSGYRFVQWSNGWTNPENGINVYNDEVFEAIFEEILQYTVTVSYDDTMGTVSGQGTYQEGSVIELTATPNQGYNFIEWSDGNIEKVRQLAVTSDVQLTALFEIKMCTVNITATEGGTVTGSGVYSYGSPVTVEAVPNEGYEFYCWSSGSTSPLYSMKVWDDYENTAIFNDASGKVIYYTTTNEDILVPNKSDVFGSNLIDNQYN